MVSSLASPYFLESQTIPPGSVFLPLFGLVEAFLKTLPLFVPALPLTLSLSLHILSFATFPVLVTSYVLHTVPSVANDKVGLSQVCPLHLFISITLFPVQIAIANF